MTMTAGSQSSTHDCHYRITKQFCMTMTAGSESCVTWITAQVGHRLDSQHDKQHTTVGAHRVPGPSSTAYKQLSLHSMQQLLSGLLHNIPVNKGEGPLLILADCCMAHSAQLAMVQAGAMLLLCLPSAIIVVRQGHENASTRASACWSSA